MSANENPVATPAVQAADEAAQQAASEAASERIWDSPIGVGTPIAFDPAIHRPYLSKEELEAILGKDDD